MTKADAHCLRLLPHRRLGSLHRLRDLHHRRPRFRMGFELPHVVFCPRIANRSLLFRHGFYSSLEGIVTAIIAAVLSDSIEVVDLCSQVPQLRWTKGGFARSSTSTWTLSTRRSSNETIRSLRAGQWQSAIRPNAASLPRRATRREVSEFARR